MKTDSKTRLDWTDDMWASYLGCPVSFIRQIKKWLQNNFITTVCFDFKTKKYSFVINRYIYNLNNEPRMIRWKSVGVFDTRQDAINAGQNNLIPCLKFPDFMMPEFRRFYLSCISIGLIQHETINVGAPKNAPQMLTFMGKTR